MKLILFLIIIGVKSLITKAAALGLLFLIFLMKDRALCFAPSRWICFIFGLSKKQIKTYAAFLYTVSALLSTVFMWYALSFAGFRYASATAVLIFFAGFAARGFQFYKLWNRYILDEWNKYHPSEGSST